jgi:hypothetical protein
LAGGDGGDQGGRYGRGIRPEAPDRRGVPERVQVAAPRIGVRDPLAVAAAIAVVRRVERLMKCETY